jgi:hypothetical protein
MCWGGPESFNNDMKNVIELYNSPNVITLNELPWVTVKEPRVHYPVMK